MNFGNLYIFHSTKSDGNLSFKWGKKEEVEKNRLAFFEKIAVKGEELVYTSLVHGKEVLMVTEKDKNKMVEADGFISMDGTGIFMMTGDCLPVVYTDNQRIFGIAHLGWRGVDLELAGIMVEKFKELKVDPGNLHIWIGPGVRKESYWKYARGVPEFLKAIEIKKWENFMEEKPDKQLALDLVGYVKAQVVEKGVKLENILISDVDTVTNMNYFSQFRSDKTGELQGRFATVVKGSF